MNFKKVGILGAGGWGTALAILLCGNGAQVNLWSHDTELVDRINSTKTNEDFLKGVAVPEVINVTNNPDVLSDCDILINCIPTQFIQNTIKNFNLPVENKFIINGSKGIEVSSLFRISEIFFQYAGTPPDKYAVLTGPSHAEEVSRKMPTTVVAASENLFFAKDVQNLFNSSKFRVYTSDDVIGCEIGGSLKNVIAIAAGVIDGLGLGDNTKAALITRGLAEISRLGIALGAKAFTFSGLSGLGDLFVTCDSKHSRNRLVGELIGKGKKLTEVINDMKMVAEGVFTTESAFRLSQKHNVEMPIAEQMHKILFEDTHPIDAINELMTRESKKEWWW
jgi:glycerol-3-phosphate dehydrogenase (NAD(P)+)